jgi:hypothetical protein
VLEKTGHRPVFLWLFIANTRNKRTMSRCCCIYQLEDTS